STGDSQPGSVDVFFGGQGNLGATFDLSSLNGVNGFVITSSDPNHVLGVGTTVSNAGDVNGDGYDDIIIGAPFTSPDGDTQGGVAYVVFGGPAGFPQTIDVAQLDGTNGFEIDGAKALDRLGISVNGAGDFNADGYADVVVTTGDGGLGIGL